MTFDSLPDRIASHLATTVRGVRVANGYNTDINSVTRPTVAPLSLRHLDAIVAIEQISHDMSLDPSSGLHWTLDWSVYVHTIVSDRAADSPESIKFEVASDIIKAVMIDVTRGGVAYDTRIERVTPVQDADTGMDGVIVSGQCAFISSYSNPFLQLVP